MRAESSLATVPGFSPFLFERIDIKPKQYISEVEAHAVDYSLERLDRYKFDYATCADTAPLWKCLQVYTVTLGCSSPGRCRCTFWRHQ